MSQSSTDNNDTPLDYTTKLNLLQKTNIIIKKEITNKLSKLSNDANKTK